MQKPKIAIFLNTFTPPHIVTLVVLAGLQALNMNIFLPSLPTMANYFDVSYAKNSALNIWLFCSYSFTPNYNRPNIRSLRSKAHNVDSNKESSQQPLFVVNFAIILAGFYFLE